MRLAILLLFLLSLFSLEVYSVGISSPYLENNTFKLIKGQSAIYSINLQNTEDIDVEVKISYDSNIAKIIDYKEVYTLPAGKLDTQISFNITAPEKARIGDIYTVSYSMKPLSMGGGGTLPIAMGIAKHFNVEIAKDPNSADAPVLWHYAAFAGVFVILIMLFSFMRKKPKKTKK